MISLCLIAASCCFTAAVIATRDGRYDAAAVFLVLFVLNTVVAVLNERRIKRLDMSRHIATIAMGDAVIRLKKELDEIKGGDCCEMQSGEPKADGSGD